MQTFVKKVGIYVVLVFCPYFTTDDSIEYFFANLDQVKHYCIAVYLEILHARVFVQDSSSQ